MQQKILFLLVCACFGLISNGQASNIKSTFKENTTDSRNVPATHLNFDGINDYINASNLIPSGSSYTKEAWIKPSSVYSNNIISSSTAAFWFWQGYLQSGNGGGFAEVGYQASSLANKWSHVAVTFDDPSHTMKLYVNGALVSQNTTVASYSSGNIQIGAFNSGIVYSGEMDEIRIWNVALTQSEIARRMNCELQGNEPGLVAYYTFDQGMDAANNLAQNSVTDASGNGHNGTLINFALTGNTSNWIAGSPVLTGIVIPSAPSAAAQHLCPHTTVADLVATGSGGALNWYTSATAGTALTTTTHLTTGTYYVAEANINGCESPRTEVAVSVLTTSMNISSRIACHGENTGAAAITALGGMPPYTYAWSNGATTSTITGLKAGTYTVTVKAVDGCIAIDSVAITEPPALTGSLSALSNVTCHGEHNGAISITTDGGTAPYNYLWNTGATTAAISGLMAGNDTVIITDSKGCSITSQYTITEPAAPVISSVAVPPNGTYKSGDVIDFTIHYSEAIVVHGNPSLSLILGTGTVSAGYNRGSGTKDLVFSYTISATDQAPNGIQTGSLLLNGGTLQNTTGCIAGITLSNIGLTTGILIHNRVAQSITFNTLPAITYGDPDFEPTATASSNLRVTYTSRNSAIATIVAGKVHVLGAGSTIITATQAGDADYLAAPAIEHELTVNKAILTVTFDNVTLCDGAPWTAIPVSVTGFKKEESTPVLTKMPVVDQPSYNTPGHYTLTAAGGVANNYAFTYSTGELTVNPLPVGTISQAPTSSGTITSFRLTAPAGAAYLWNTSEPTPVITTSSAGTYTVRVTNAEGCSADFTTQVSPPVVNVSNTFSPNGDGINDYWVIPALKDYPDVAVTIVNRDGQVVFESSHFTRWDGRRRSSGDVLPAGVYFYQIRIKPAVAPVTGWLNLVR